MLLSHTLKTLQDFPLHPIHSLFSGGLTCDNPFVPDNILVWQSSSDRTMTDVSIHQRMILKVILSGDIITLVDGVRIPMSAGDMILFFPFQFHATQLLCPTQDYSFLAITFTETKRDYSPLLPLKYHVLHPDERDEENLATLIRAQNNPQQAMPEKSVLALMEILLTQRRKTLVDPNATRGIPSASDDVFDRICTYIRNNFDRQLSLKTVAAEFKLSEETLRRLFHKYYGSITPGTLIRRLRMQFAIELLEHTRESIATISKRCGYDDTFVFSKAFKRLFGYSPLNYRKQFQDKIGKP